MRQFAEDEIVLPTGPCQGERFRVATNPHAGVLLDEIDSGRWRRFFPTGPTQSGKTLLCFVIVIMWHLFEVGETVLCAAPSEDLVADKWNEDILPVIAASRYRDLLPDRGSGSKGGKVTSIKFKHGPTLRFMTGGGDDKSRSSFTTRVLVVTEVEGFDVIGGNSREADKFTQLEQRTEAFGERARIYGECTVGTEKGRVWQEQLNGSNSRIAIQCVHCESWVTPEREHLVGWKNAETELQAEQEAGVVCPKCGVLWSEADRFAAVKHSRVLHGKQTINDAGEVVGDPPMTHTFSFRWTAINNLLKGIGVTAVKEWKAQRSADIEVADKALRQFSWALPHVPDAKDVNHLTIHDIASRVERSVPHRLMPDDVEAVTVGVDVNKYMLTWTAVAWRRTPEGLSPFIPEYGRQDVHSREFGEEVAILMALRKLRDEVILPGWMRVGGGARVQPLATAVDAGWHQAIIAKFVSESEGFVATKGIGAKRFGGRSEEREKGSRMVAQGTGWEAWQLPTLSIILVEPNADYWKSYVHARLETPPGKVGALMLSQPPASSQTAHMGFARHMLSEKKVEEYVGGKGLVTRFVSVTRENHLLDSTALACVAASTAGRSVLPDSPPDPRPEPEPVPTAAGRSDGSNFINAYRGRY